MSKGRPKNPELQEKTKSALLQAAKVKLAQKPIKGITIRELAESANTQSAMISYYFGGKFGLIEALIKQTAAERKLIVSGILSDAFSQPERAIDIFIDGVLNMLSTEAWLFKLVQEDQLSSNEEVRKVVMNEFAGLGAGAINQLLSELQRLGLVKQNINTQFFAASFVSLVGSPIMNPFLLKVIANFEIEIIHTDEWKQFISTQLKSVLVEEG